MKTRKIMNESFQRSTCVLLFFQKNPVCHSLFGARSGSVRANDKEKGDNKNYLCLCTRRTENRIGINEKAFEKEKDILIITFIENRSKSWNKFRSSFCRSIFKVLNVLIFSRLESLVAWIIRIIIFTCLKSRLGASRSLIHHVIIHNIIASSRAAWN